MTTPPILTDEQVAEGERLYADAMESLRDSPYGQNPMPMADCSNWLEHNLPALFASIRALREERDAFVTLGAHHQNGRNKAERERDAAIAAKEEAERHLDALIGMYEGDGASTWDDEWTRTWNAAIESRKANEP